MLLRRILFVLLLTYVSVNCFPQAQLIEGPNEDYYEKLATKHHLRSIVKNDGRIITVLFDSLGKTLSFNIKYADGRLSASEEYKYDQKGMIVWKKSLLNEFGTSYVTESLTTDKTGNIIMTSVADGEDPNYHTKIFSSRGKLLVDKIKGFRETTYAYYPNDTLKEMKIFGAVYIPAKGKYETGLIEKANYNRYGKAIYRAVYEEGKLTSKVDLYYKRDTIFLFSVKRDLVYKTRAIDEYMYNTAGKVIRKSECEFADGKYSEDHVSYMAKYDKKGRLTEERGGKSNYLVTRYAYKGDTIIITSLNGRGGGYDLTTSELDIVTDEWFLKPGKRLIKLLSYHENKLSETTLLNYDDAGRLIEKKHYYHSKSSANDLPVIYRNTYNENGMETSHVTQRGDEVFLKVDRLYQGDKLLRRTESDGKVITEDINSYDEKMQLVREEHIRNGESKWVKEYKYDHAGNMIEQKSVTGNFTSIENFTFNELGLLLRRETKNTGQEPRIETMEYTFY